MKEIEKLDWSGFVRGEVDAAENIVAKMNEVIDAVNALIITHPKLEDAAKLRRDFKELQDEQR